MICVRLCESLTCPLVFAEGNRPAEGASFESTTQPTMAVLSWPAILILLVAVIEPGSSGTLMVLHFALSSLIEI